MYAHTHTSVNAPTPTPTHHTQAEAAAFLQFQGMLAKLKVYNEHEANAQKMAFEDDASDDD